VTEKKWNIEYKYDPETKRLTNIEFPADLPAEQRMGLEIPFINSLILATQRLDDNVNKHSRILNKLTIALIVLTFFLVALGVFQILVALGVVHIIR